MEGSKLHSLQNNKVMQISSILMSSIEQDTRVRRICDQVAELGFSVNAVSLSNNRNSEIINFDNWSVYTVRKINYRFESFKIVYQLQRFIIFYIAVIKASSQSDWIIINDFKCWPIFLHFKIFSRKKIWYDCHEYSPNDFPDGSMQARRWIKVIEKYLCKRADITTVVSGGIKDLFSRDYDVKNINLLRNIPSKPKCRSKVAGKKKHSRTSVVYQGIFSKGRGLERLLSALEKENADLRDFDFYFAGGGELSELVNTASQLPNVFYLGWLSSDELHEMTSKMHIGYCVIEPLCISYDLSLPNKYFQYCHAQIPMILGNSSELSGILKHHNVGEIWEKGSLSNCLNNIKLNYAEHCAAIHAHNEIVTWEKDFDLVIENLRKLSVQS